MRSWWSQGEMGRVRLADASRQLLAPLAEVDRYSFRRSNSGLDKLPSEIGRNASRLEQVLCRRWSLQNVVARRIQRQKREAQQFFALSGNVVVSANHIFPAK